MNNGQEENYLSSLMQNISLSDDNHRGNNNVVPNQNRGPIDKSEVSHNHRLPTAIHNMTRNYYNPFYQSGSSASTSASASASSSSYNNNNNFPIQFVTSAQSQSHMLPLPPPLPLPLPLPLPALYPSTRDFLYDRSNLILECFYDNPYHVMTNRKTCDDFKLVLKNCHRIELKNILHKIIHSPKHLLAAAFHVQGVSVIKELIHVSKRLPHVSELPRIFASLITYLMNDQCGRFVVEQCFRHLDCFKNKPLYDELLNHWFEIATSKYGCITLQNCMDFMEFSPFSYEVKMCLHLAIATNAASLARDPYGIFVLQHVVPLKNDLYDRAVVESLKPWYLDLCTSKSGSFLIEKYVTTYFRSIIAEELIQANTLVLIAINEYGNYIIQHLLKQTKRHEMDLHERLCNVLLGNLAVLECNPYSGKIAYMLKAERRDEFRGWQTWNYMNNVYNRSSQHIM